MSILEPDHWSFILAQLLAGASKDPRAATNLAMAQWKNHAEAFFGYQEGMVAKGIGGSSEALRSSSSTLKRKGRLYRPDTAPEGAPLVVMLHGCMQSAEGFAKLTGMNELAKRDGFCVLYPDQDSDANPMQCWNWHDASNQQRVGGEPEALSELIRKAQAITGSPPEKTHVAGISAGGALSSLMAHLYPELLGSCAIIAGPMPFSAQGLPQALTSMKYGPKENASAPQSAEKERSLDAQELEAFKKPFSYSPRKRLPMLIVHGQADEVVNHKHALSQAEGALALNKHLGSLNGHGPSVIAASESLNPAGDIKVWKDEEGQAIAVLVSPSGLKHAWSGGNLFEPFSQQGFSASQLALNFFNAVQSKSFEEFEADYLADRLWNVRAMRNASDASKIQVSAVGGHPVDPTQLPEPLAELPLAISAAPQEATIERVRIKVTR